MSELALIFLVNLVTAFFKKIVYPTWGRVGVQVVVFLASVVGALWITFSSSYPNLKDFVATVIGLFSLAVALYEVILSRFQMFKQEVVGR